MSTWLARAGREWPVWIAVLGAGSLLLLPSVLHREARAPEAEARLFESLRDEAGRGDSASARARLEAYLARYPGSPYAPEAERLLTRAILAGAEAGKFPGGAALLRAEAELAREPRSPETAALRRQAALSLAEFGMVREAVGALRGLADDTREPALALDLVPALARLAALEPERRHPLLDEASTRISEYLRSAGPAERVLALVAQGALYRVADRDLELEKLLGAEIAKTSLPRDRGLLFLERGRALARLGKHREMEAMACFDEAEKLLEDPLARGLAMVDQAELFARAGNRDCVEICNRVLAAHSPAAPLASLVRGAFELGTQPAAGLEALRIGLSRIRRPREIDDSRFDFGWVYGLLEAAAGRETDPGRLSLFPGLWAEISRLRPASITTGFDHAAVLLRAGRPGEAADRYLESIRSERTPLRERARGCLAAAEACEQGGLYLRAAALYRDFYALAPDAHAVGLYRRAICLEKAGDRAGALPGFEEYLAQAGPSGANAGLALLEKAGILQADGRPEEALVTYDRVLGARDVATSPARPEWAQALLGRGRTLLALSRATEARKTLEEFLERYGEGPSPAPASMEAAGLLVSAAIHERRWAAGLAALRELQSLAKRLSDADRTPYLSVLEESRSLEGDLEFGLEDYRAACQAYGEAAVRTGSPEGRLRGLIGRARSLARLERKTEARRDYSDARAAFEAGSWSGPSRTYWEIALGAVEEEVR